MARKITHIVIHCTGGPQNQTVAQIQRYWRESLGWKSPGYHVIILPDGSTQILQDYEKKTNGVAGHNANSIHICYIGGVDRLGRFVDNRTLQQQFRMKVLVQVLLQQYPGVKVCGHRDFSPDKNGNGKIEASEFVKQCPCFDVASWMKKELN
jgi:N-acetylmuramoyl-L-alanine amidase